MNPNKVRQTFEVSYTVRGEGKPLLWLYTRDIFDGYPLNAILSALGQKFRVYAVASPLIVSTITDSEFDRHMDKLQELTNEIGDSLVLCGDIVEAGIVLRLTAATPAVTRIALYGPKTSRPNVDPLAVSTHMATELAQGETEAALITYYRNVLCLSPQQIATLQSRVHWQPLDRILYQIVEGLRGLTMPTLVVVDQSHGDPQLPEVEMLKAVLPNLQVRRVEGVDAGTST